jgi:hypothetical protein
MLRTFVYYEKKGIWMEESHLLFHDLAGFLDEEEKTLYLWNGPKSTEDRLGKAYEAINDLFGNFPDPEFVNSLNIVILEEEFIPEYIQERIDRMLEAVTREEEEEKYTFTRLWTIRMYFTFSLIAILLATFSLLNLTLGHSVWLFYQGNRVVTDTTYNLWIWSSVILFSISLILSILNLLVGIVEREVQVMVFSVVGIFVFSGLVGYLSQDIYLFLFQPGSISEIYFISITDLAIFSSLILFATMIFLLPNLYKFLIFTKNYRDYIF